MYRLQLSEHFLQFSDNDGVQITDLFFGSAVLLNCYLQSNAMNGISNAI